MTTPDYVKILKLDKLALKAKTQSEFLERVKVRLPYARKLGIGDNFSFFVEQAWILFGDGK